MYVCLNPTRNDAPVCQPGWDLANLTLHDFNCIGNLSTYVGSAQDPRCQGGAALHEPQNTQARGFNAALVWRFPAHYGYMPEALNVPH